MKIKQYYPRFTELPKLGAIVHLVNRQGDEQLGVVYGVYPKERIAVIQTIEDKDEKMIERILNNENTR